MDRRIFHLKNLLAERIDHEWTIEQMASEIGMSDSHFNRLFKATMSMAPRTYLTRLRIETAGAMLSDPKCFLRIKEISFRVGFLSESHFARAFGKHYGVAPTEYRKNYGGSKAS